MARPFLFRAAEPPRGLRTAAIILAAYIASLLPVLFVPGGAAVWPGNGLVVAALLLLPRRLAVATAFTCFLTNLMLVAVLDGQLVNIIYGPALNLVEAVAVAALARRYCGAALDMTGRRRFFNLIVFAVAPAVLACSAVDAAISWAAFGKPLLQTYLRWFSADGAGLLLTVPAILLIAKAPRFKDCCEAKRPERVVMLALTVAVSAAAFGQRGVPATFLVFPLLVLTAFRLGPPGAAMVVLIVSAFGLAGAMAGTGPIGLLTHLDGRERLQLVQFFLLVVLFTAIPTTAALSERSKMRLRLQRRMSAARAARREAEAAAETKTRFLAVMSHEIRTPLNGVLGFVQLMKDRPDLPDGVRRQVKLMGGSCRVLLSLVNDVLDYSKMDADRLELDPRPFALEEVVASAEAMIRPLAEEKGVALTVDVAAVRDRVHVGDDNRIAQVLLNLLTNAAKFTDAGVITVQVEAEPADDGGDRVRIRVRDTGVGVPAESRERMFQPFSQADNTITRKYGGTGLGLAISQRLVRLMGGTIGYEPLEPHGSEFWFALPLARATEAPAERPTAAPVLEGLKVLVVDDHPINREVASLMLSAAGCTVATGADGMAAVAMAREQRYDLILMDLHMPSMDGLAATQAIRGLPQPVSSTPILALTADTSPQDVERCLSVGMQGHVAKPIQRDALIRAVARFARRPAPDPQTLAAAS